MDGKEAIVSDIVEKANQTAENLGVQTLNVALGYYHFVAVFAEFFHEVGYKLAIDMVGHVEHLFRFTQTRSRGITKENFWTAKSSTG